MRMHFPVNPIFQKMVASGNEKLEHKNDIAQLIEKGKAKGSLSNNDIMEALEYSDYDIELIEKIYDMIESNGIEVTNYINPAEFENTEIEVEQLEPQRIWKKCFSRKVLR